MANLTQSHPQGFPKEFNRKLIAGWDRRFLILLLASLVVNVSFIAYMAGRWHEEKVVDWASQQVVEETGAIQLKLENHLVRPLAGSRPGIQVSAGGGEVAEATGAGEGGPRRVNRGSIGTGKRYAGHEVAFMAPTGGASASGRARKEFAPMIGTSKGYDFRPGQLSVHTDAGALGALASVRKGPAEVYEAGGLKTVVGTYEFSDVEGQMGLSGTMEIGVTERKAEGSEIRGGARSYQSIYDVVSGNRSQIFYCLHGERKRDVTLKGNIELEVTLDLTGNVTNVNFTGKTWWSNPTSGKRVEQCIRNIIQGWNFGIAQGSPGSRTTFNLSFLWT